MGGSEPSPDLSIANPQFRHAMSLAFLPPISRRLFAVALVWCFMSAVTWADDKAVKTLAETPIFAFGGIGYAGITSQGENAFRNVLASDSAAADFLRVVKIGNPQAQCYGLIGLRLKDRAAYDEQVKHFVTSRKEVQTCAGCMMSKQLILSVVANIRNGAFDKQAEARRSRR